MQKYQASGNSLAVQWLGLCTVTAVAPGQSLVGELTSHKPRGVAKKEKRKISFLRPPAEGPHYEGVQVADGDSAPFCP